MSSVHKTQLLNELRERFGDLRKLPGSQSLFTLGADAARIYFRYSKIHEGGRTFFGLREVDLRQLEGRNGFINAQAARDGQYKVQLIAREVVLELYIARQGRFNIEAYVGFDALEGRLEASRLRGTHDLSHLQVQTLLAGIGHIKRYDVYIPENDAGRLDWSLTKRFALRESIPTGFHEVRDILSEIDVVWVASGRNAIQGLFEVEHSTPIYSGLLRFNDVLLADPRVSRFSIVSNDSRRAVFARQLSRPTFRKSGLAELASFLEYANVLEWHTRLTKGDSA